MSKPQRTSAPSAVSASKAACRACPANSCVLHLTDGVERMESKL